MTTATAADTSTLYAQRLARYTTAMRRGKPDRVPIRPFVAEFVAKYAGYTCQDVTQDFNAAFAATRKTAGDFGWDATVPNMVYVWGGIPQHVGLRYYAIPGVGLAPDTGFQYLEPPEDQAWMRADEYDQLIADPTKYLFNVWLPRVSADVVAPGQPSTYRNNVSFLKGGMTMLSYFGAFGPAIEQLRREAGVVSAIAGILKAPFDILADKLRGYTGLCMDLMDQPEKVMAACEALAPHLYHVALASSDPTGTVPVGFWMHRGCVPFISRKQFEGMFWPTLRPIIENLWAHGRQTLFYAEGKWGAHLDAFADLPKGSIVFHVDRDDIFEVHKKLGHKFCLSGGVPNWLLAYGQPQEVRDCCKRIIDGVAGDGGYIMDASAIVQNDATVENMRAMTETTFEYGEYPGGGDPTPPAAEKASRQPPPLPPATGMPPGVAVPWAEKVKELPPITAKPELVQKIWEDFDALAYTYIWQLLESF